MAKAHPSQYWIRAYQWEILVDGRKLPFLDASLTINTGAKRGAQMASLEVRRALSSDPVLRRLAQKRQQAEIVLRSRPDAKSPPGAPEQRGGDRIMMTFRQAVAESYHLAAEHDRIEHTTIQGTKLKLPDNVVDMMAEAQQRAIAKVIARVSASEAQRDMIASELAVDPELAKEAKDKLGLELDEPEQDDPPGGILWLAMIKDAIEGLTMQFKTEGAPVTGRGVDNVQSVVTLECVSFASDSFDLGADDPSPGRWRNLDQADAYRSLCWLLDPTDDFRGTGRTHVLVEAIVETAMDNPGHMIPILHQSTTEKVQMKGLIGERCDKLGLDWSWGSTGDGKWIEGLVVRSES